MSTEIEDRLVAALRAGAAAITDESPPAFTPSPPRRRGIVLALVAAAAVVIAVAALAVGLGRSHHGPTPPETSHPVGSSPFHALTCTVPLPASWRAAIRSHALPHEGVEPRLLAVDSAGAALIESFVEAGDVALVLAGPDGSTRTLYTTSVSSRFGAANVSGDWAVVSVGGDAGTDEFDAVNLISGAHRAIRQPSFSTALVVSPPVILDGVVYWSEVSDAGEGSVYGYDLATRTRRTLDTGHVLDPIVVGGGVVWAKDDRTVVHVTPTLPPGYQIDPTRSAQPVSDGTTTAWTALVGSPRDLRAEVRMDTTDHREPTAIYRGAADEIVDPVAVSGPYVSWAGTGRSVLLDTRSGAGVVGGASAAGGGSLAFVDPLPGVHIAVVPIAELPALRC